MKHLKHFFAAFVGIMTLLSFNACNKDDNKDNTPDKADKAALQAEIATAEKLLSDAVIGTEEGQYPQSAADALSKAIDDAKKVNLDEEATQAQVDSAVSALKSAEKKFSESVNPAAPKVDKTALEAAISAAKEVLAAAEVGDRKGQWAQEAVDAFDEAIKAAEKVYDNAEATQEDVDGAVTALDAAKETFLAEVNTEDPAEPVDERLALWLQFNGKAEDASSYGHSVELKTGETGQPAPSLAEDRMGAPDAAYKFEGGFMNIPYHSSLNTSTMSVMFWLKQDELSATDTAPLSLSWWDCYMAKVIGDPAKEKNELAFVAGGASVQSGVFIETGVWYHVAITRSASSLDIYVDGELKNTQECSGPMNVNEYQPLRIGVLSENPGYYYPFFGYLDEVRIYTEALSAEDILEVYNAERP